MALADSVETERSYGDILVGADQVNARIQEMAGFLVDHFDGESPLFITLLNGGAPFAARLMAKITELDDSFHPQQEFMTVSRYGADRQPTRLPRLVMGLPPRYIEGGELQGRKTVILDDLKDKGGTAAFTDKYLTSHGAAGVDLVTLAAKLIEPEGQEYKDPLITGFWLPDIWITGMGMDDINIAPEANRHAPWIATARGIPAPTGWAIS